MDVMLLLKIGMGGKYWDCEGPHGHQIDCTREVRFPDGSLSACLGCAPYQHPLPPLLGGSSLL